MNKTIAGLACVLATGCADRIKIDDERQLGSVVVLKDWFTSAALLQTSAGPVLFDAGFREGAMRRALEQQDVDPASVVAVLLTHGHGDHLGAMALYPDADVYARAEEATLVEEESEGTIEIDVPLADGEVLAFGDHTVEVFAVSGHTPGSAAYLVDGEVLLLGDTALVARDGTIQPVDEERSADPKAAAAALAALAETLAPRADEIAWLVPSHSAAVAGLGPLQDYADTQQ